MAPFFLVAERGLGPKDPPATRTLLNPDPVNIQKIPLFTCGRLSDFSHFSETSFLVQVSDSAVGDLKLARLGTYDQDLGTTLSLNLPSMKYDLKSVTCDFGSN
jgi:hypothetical protein